MNKDSVDIIGDGKNVNTDMLGDAVAKSGAYNADTDEIIIEVDGREPIKIDASALSKDIFIKTAVYEDGKIKITTTEGEVLEVDLSSLAGQKIVSGKFQGPASDLILTREDGETIMIETPEFIKTIESDTQNGNVIAKTSKGKTQVAKVGRINDLVQSEDGSTITATFTDESTKDFDLTSVGEAVIYSHSSKSDNYGQENGNKPFLFYPNSAKDKNIEVSEDGKYIRVLKDCVVNISLQEGIEVPAGTMVEVQLVPKDGDIEDRESYKSFLITVLNSEDGIKNVLRRYSYIKVSSWTSTSFEWVGIPLRKDGWFTFKIFGIPNDAKGFDGQGYGHISIQGEKAQ